MIFEIVCCDIVERHKVPIISETKEIITISKSYTKTKAVLHFTQINVARTTRSKKLIVLSIGICNKDTHDCPNVKPITHKTRKRKYFFFDSKMRVMPHNPVNIQVRLTTVLMIIFILFSNQSIKC
jgi:hypothetical protein